MSAQSLIKARERKAELAAQRHAERERRLEEFRAWCKRDAAAYAAYKRLRDEHSWSHRDARAAYDAWRAVAELMPDTRDLESDTA